MTSGYRKIKLFSLMVALIVAGLAVVGGTWATRDQVDYNGSEATVNPGRDFDVELLYLNKGEDKYIKPSSEKDVFSECIWCPGRTEIVMLRVYNNEAFAVDVHLNMKVDNQSGLGNVLTAAWLTDLKGATSYTNWNDFLTAADQNYSRLNVEESIKVLDGERNKYAIPTEQCIDIALAVHMDESATSVYEGLSISIDFEMQVNADYEPGETPNPNAG